MAFTSRPFPIQSADDRGARPGPVLGMEDLAETLGGVVREAIALKAQAQRGPLPQLLAGKAVVQLYEKPSTRTRLSFDIGIQRLGGISSVIEAQTSQLGRGESIEDTAKVMSRYADAIVYRAKSHEALKELALHADVPVINALTDVEHPCQVLADLTTLAEHVGGFEKLHGRTLAYVGDGNNMCHSYLIGAPLAGMHVQVATPPAYSPSADIIERANALAKAHGTTITLTDVPEKAVATADAVATDTWVSMGDEDEAEAREAAFDGYTLDHAIMELAAPDAVFLHCLPGHWGHEATYELAHGPRSLIWTEAENRMWAQMALLARLIA